MEGKARRSWMSGEGGTADRRSYNTLASRNDLDIRRKIFNTLIEQHLRSLKFHPLNASFRLEDLEVKFVIVLWATS